MNLTKKTNKELLKLMNDVSCELYDRIKENNLKTDKAFHDIWIAITALEEETVTDE